MGLSASYTVSTQTPKTNQPVHVFMQLSGVSGLTTFQNLRVTPIFKLSGSTDLTPTCTHQETILLGNMTSDTTKSLSVDFVAFAPATATLGKNTGSMYYTVQFRFDEDTTPSSTLTAITDITASTYGV